MSYTVKWLDNEEFDRLPYPDMDVSLGVADPKNKTAFIRRTGINGLDFFNTLHELEHLEDGKEGVHADHFENGVYYKKMGNVFESIAPIAASFIPGIGPVAGPALGVGLQMKNNAKAQKQAQQQSQQQSSSMMDQFGEGPATSQTASPAVSQVGGQGGAMSSGGQGGDIGSRIRQILNQRQSGFYSGRDAGRI